MQSFLKAFLSFIFLEVLSGTAPTNFKRDLFGIASTTLHP